MKTFPVEEIANNLDVIVGEPGWELKGTRLGPIVGGNRRTIEVHISKGPVSNGVRMLTAVDGMVSIDVDDAEPVPVAKAAKPIKPAKTRENGAK